MTIGIHGYCGGSKWGGGGGQGWHSEESTFLPGFNGFHCICGLTFFLVLYSAVRGFPAYSSCCDLV